MPAEVNNAKPTKESLLITRFLADCLVYKKELESGELSDKAKEKILDGLELIVQALGMSDVELTRPDHESWWGKLKTAVRDLWKYTKKAGYYAGMLIFLLTFILIFLLLTTNAHLHVFVKSVSEIFFQTMKLFYKAVYRIVKGVLTMDPKQMLAELTTIQQDYVKKIDDVLNELKRTSGIPQGTVLLILGGINISFLYVYVYATTHV